MPIRILYVLLCWWLGTGVLAQSDTSLATWQSHPLPQERWEELRAELDYQPPPDWQPQQPIPMPDAQPTPDSPVLVWVLVGIGLLIVGWLARKLLTARSTIPPQQSSTTATNGAPAAAIDIQVLYQDLAAEIATAEAQGNWQAALRGRYLQLLQALHHNHLSRWQPDKTNQHYLADLAGSDYYADFRHLMRAYERGWYGNHDLGAAAYQQLLPQAAGLLARLRAASPAQVPHV